MRSTLITFSLAIAVLATGATATCAQQTIRTWSSRESDETIDATFHRYDPKTKLVALQIPDGEIIYVGLKQLSRPDQRFVTNVARNGPHKLKREENRVAKSKQNKRSRSNRKRPSNTVLAYGIHWTPGMNNALESATGNPAAEDDRPVMWLRVLGDLDGLM